MALSPFSLWILPFKFHDSAVKICSRCRFGLLCKYTRNNFIYFYLFCRKAELGIFLRWISIRLMVGDQERGVLDIFSLFHLTCNLGTSVR